jgi:hypothetical protein
MVSAVAAVAVVVDAVQVVLAEFVLVLEVRTLASCSLTTPKACNRMEGAKNESDHLVGC